MAGDVSPVAMFHKGWRAEHWIGGILQQQSWLLVLLQCRVHLLELPPFTFTKYILAFFSAFLRSLHQRHHNHCWDPKMKSSDKDKKIKDKKIKDKKTKRQKDKKTTLQKDKKEDDRRDWIGKPQCSQYPGSAVDQSLVNLPINMMLM